MWAKTDEERRRVRDIYIAAQAALGEPGEIEVASAPMFWVVMWRLPDGTVLREKCDALQWLLAIGADENRLQVSAQAQLSYLVSKHRERARRPGLLAQWRAEDEAELAELRERVAELEARLRSDAYDAGETELADVELAAVDMLVTGNGYLTVEHPPAQ